MTAARKATKGRITAIRVVMRCARAMLGEYVEVAADSHRWVRGPGDDLVAFVQMPRRPWQALPSEVAEVLRAELEDVADEIIAEIRACVPPYAKPLEGAFGRGVRTDAAVPLGH